MIYRFHSYTLDAARHELSQGDQLLAIEPKVFQVLLYLLENRDRVLSKEELLEQCWPDTFVSESALTRCLTRLRKTVHAPPVIKTLHRQGYRFIAEVTELAPDEPLTEPTPIAQSGDKFVSITELSATTPPPESSQIDQELRQDHIQAQPPAVSTPIAERRQLTVLSCELVEGASLVAQLDPEELHRLVQTFHTICIASVTQFDGYIAQLSEYNLLVYLGYPQAHEDDAQRAIRTGLHLIEAFSRDFQTQEHVITVRVGIHTGLVVLEPGHASGTHVPLAVGATPTIAESLKNLATPGTVVISEMTAQLVEGYFRWQDQGVHQLAGYPQPLSVYLVTDAIEQQTRLDIAVARGLTPFVGRTTELSLLQERWDEAEDGLGQIILLSGEAGIGKSRLIREFRTGLGDDSYSRLECHCSPYHQHTALYPVIELLRRVMQQGEDTLTEKEQIKQLEQLAQQFRLDVQESVVLLASLLALSLPTDRYPPLDATPQRKRQRTMETLLAMVLALAEEQPVLFIVEDLHWIDPSTLEWLGLLIDQGPTASLMAIMTCRPTFQSPWSGRSHVTSLTLNRLPRRHVVDMVQDMTRATAVSTIVIEQVVSSTDGIPFFIEEMTKLVVQSEQTPEGDDSGETAASRLSVNVPATLQDSLMARLDGLGNAKRTAQLGATIGREFSDSLLRAVSHLDEVTLSHELRSLVEAELIYQRGVGEQSTYIFKHALIQEVAYISLLKQTKQQYHAQIAQVLDSQFPEISAFQPELIAHHYTEAASFEQAVVYWYQAGELANERSAHFEAIAHFQQGLVALSELPETPLRAQHELGLQLALCIPLIATESYASSKVKYSYNRAYKLCQKLGENPQLFPALFGLWLLNLVKSNLHVALQLGEQCLSIAKSVEDHSLLLEAHLALGVTQYYCGKFQASYTNLKQGIDLYNPELHRSHAHIYGQDPGVVCRGFAGLALWFLGYLDQSRQNVSEALVLANESTHLYTRAFGNFFTQWHFELCRELQHVQEWAEKQIAFCREQGFPLWLATGTMSQGWALVNQKEVEMGMAAMQEGLGIYYATGSELSLPYWCALIAQVHVKLGQPEDGLLVLDDGINRVNQTEEGLYEAELNRLKGELLLIQDSDNQIESEICFQHALSVALKQEAKSLELRTVMSLARLWQSQGNGNEARKLLAPIYGWFTEGFDTADLLEAKALLEELA